MFRKAVGMFGKNLALDSCQPLTSCATRDKALHLPALVSPICKTGWVQLSLCSLTGGQAHLAPRTSWQRLGARGSQLIVPLSCADVAPCLPSRSPVVVRFSKKMTRKLFMMSGSWGRPPASSTELGSDLSKAYTSLGMTPGSIGFQGSL